MGRTRPGIGDSSNLSAALILKKLANYPRQNGLAKALEDIGKVERSLFGLDRYQDVELEGLEVPVAELPPLPDTLPNVFSMADEDEFPASARGGTDEGLARDR